ncbi:ABC transporter substrate-binding protein [Streptomyces sp. M19]
MAPQDEPGLKAAGFTLLSRANPGLPFALTVNADRPATRERAVRRAVQLGIDREEVTDTVLSGRYRPATSALASTTTGYTDLRDRLGHDPEEAKRLLDRAGWRPGPGGVRVKDGRKLTLKVLWATNFGPNQSALELIQQQLRTIGVQLTLKSFSIGDFVSVRQKGDYDYAWGNTTRVDPDILRTSFSGKLLNLSRLDDRDLDATLDKEAAAADPKRRAGYAADAQERVLDQGYQVPVFELTTVLGTAKKVHDLDFEASSRLQFHDTWLS